MSKQGPPGNFPILFGNPGSRTQAAACRDNQNRQFPACSHLELAILLTQSLFGQGLLLSLFALRVKLMAVPS